MVPPENIDTRFTTRLREVWPAERPLPALADEPEAGRPVAGLRKLLDAIRTYHPEPIRTIVEIGGELGGSTRLFLREFPDARVITVDPWPAKYRHVEKKWPQIAAHAAADDHSYYRVFMSLNWEWRNRLLPMRTTSGIALPELLGMGVKPDLIYLDGLHTFHGCYDDMVLSHFLFPEAVISGDDWEFNPGLEHTQFMGHQLPVRKAATEFAFVHGRLAVHTVENSYFFAKAAAAPVAP